MLNLEIAEAAPLFAALGDPTRLDLVARLSEKSPQSLKKLLADATMSRQAISKHLAVLESAGLVQSNRAGRESHYMLERSRLELARAYLDHVSNLWDMRLERLKLFVEEQE